MCSGETRRKLAIATLLIAFVFSFLCVIAPNWSNLTDLTQDEIYTSAGLWAECNATFSGCTWFLLDGFDLEGQLGVWVPVCQSITVVSWALLLFSSIAGGLLLCCNAESVKKYKCPGTCTILAGTLHALALLVWEAGLHSSIAKGGSPFVSFPPGHGYAHHGWAWCLGLVVALMCWVAGAMLACTCGEGKEEDEYEELSEDSAPPPPPAAKGGKPGNKEPVSEGQEGDQEEEGEEGENSPVNGK